jgi:hypothetical protein
MEEIPVLVEDLLFNLGNLAFGYIIAVVLGRLMMKVGEFAALTVEQIV